MIISLHKLYCRSQCDHIFRQEITKPTGQKLLNSATSYQISHPREIVSFRLNVALKGVTF